MKEKPKPEELIPIARRVEFSDTLELFKQVLRFDIIVKEGRVRGVQLLLDRISKFRKEESKPVAYFLIEDTRTLYDIATAALAAASVLHLGNSEDVNEENIKKDAEWVTKMIKEDVEVNARILLRKLGKNV